MATSAGSPADPLPRDPTLDKPPRPRRWIPVSVRLLFLLALVFGFVGFSWIAVRGYTNADLINEVEQLGGKVTLRPCTPEWLQRQDYGDWTTLLDDIESINPGYGQATDEWLARLKGFTSLEDLWLSGPAITDAGLQHLKGFKNLRRLGLDHTRVTDAGMVHVSGMTNLEYLSLEGTQVGDAGLAHVSRLQNLQHLNLEFVPLTNAGLAQLKGLTNLKTLRLSMVPPELDGGITDLKHALPELVIEDGTFIVGRYPWYHWGRSPLFFASGALLMTGAVVMWLLWLVYLIPLAVVKLSAWFAGWRKGVVLNERQSLAPKCFPVRLWGMVKFARLTGVLIIVTAGLLVALPIVRQQLAVHALERLGGSFVKRARNEERWLHSTVGVLQQLNSMTCLQELWFIDDHVVDSNLASLDRLTTLQLLRLSGTQITDAALPHIQKLVELRELNLRNTRVTDAGLPALKSLGQLIELDLSDTGITNAGTAHLAEIVSLKDLRLSNTAITDAGMSHLSRLTALTWLDLEGTGISDAGLAHLAKLTQLKHLDLVNMPKVTAKGIASLQNIPNLESLSLDGTQFAEAGVESLRPLKKLNSLSLKSTQMSQADVDATKQALPDVFVHLEK